MSAEIAEHLRPYEQQIQRLSTIPGIKRRLAEVILAEIGPDMSRFPSARHLALWAGMVRCITRTIPAHKARWRAVERVAYRNRFLLENRSRIP
jgi:transposase